MSYIGKEPQFTQYPSKFFNGDGTAMTVTLDYSPPNAAALLVFIDGVRQDTSAYTLSGTSLTFTGAVPSGTNNVQVVHLGLTQDVGVPSDDTISTVKIQDDAVSTVKIQDDAVTSAKLANSLNITSGNSLTIDSGATITNNGSALGFGGNNTPAFYAYLSSSQGITSGTWTKVQFDNEVYDTGSAYDPTTNYRFTVPSGEGGKYFISGQGRLLGVYLSWGQLAIYKNGTIIAQNGGQYGTNDYRFAINVSRVLELSAGDYIEIYAYLTGGSPLSVEGSASVDLSAFFGFKLVE